jgi:hypothetical protein
MKISYYKPVSIAKNRILPFFWIPACAGMTASELISITYKTGHTREEPAPVQTGAGIQALKLLFMSPSSLKFWLVGPLIR